MSLEKINNLRNHAEKIINQIKANTESNVAQIGNFKVSGILRSVKIAPSYLKKKYTDMRMAMISKKAKKFGEQLDAHMESDTIYKTVYNNPLFDKPNNNK